MSLMNDLNKVSSEGMAWTYFLVILFTGVMLGWAISMFKNKKK